MSDSAMMPPGAPASSASAISRRSNRGAGRGRSVSKAMRRETPVERAPAQSQRPGSQRDVAIEAAERLLDEQTLRVLERELIEVRWRRRAARPEREVAGTHQVALRQQHGALHRVLQLA